MCQTQPTSSDTGMQTSWTTETPSTRATAGQPHFQSWQCHAGQRAPASLDPVLHPELLRGYAWLLGCNSKRQAGVGSWEDEWQCGKGGRDQGLGQQQTKARNNGTGWRVILTPGMIFGVGAQIPMRTGKGVGERGQRVGGWTSSGGRSGGLERCSAGQSRGDDH